MFDGRQIDGRCERFKWGCVTHVFPSKNQQASALCTYSDLEGRSMTAVPPALRTGEELSKSSLVHHFS